MIKTKLEYNYNKKETKIDQSITSKYSEIEIMIDVMWAHYLIDTLVISQFSDQPHPSSFYRRKKQYKDDPLIFHLHLSLFYGLKLAQDTLTHDGNFDQHFQCICEVKDERWCISSRKDTLIAIIVCGKDALTNSKCSVFKATFIKFPYN